jgi:hypothetical protein
MELTKYSENRFYETFVTCNVPKEFADPIYNYFVHGFSPGSFFTALLANDFVGAMCRSHPANTVEGLKMLSIWLQNSGLKTQAWGNYNTVDRWLRMDEGLRRALLEQAELIYSQEQEIMMTLKGEKTYTPLLF